VQIQKLPSGLKCLTSSRSMLRTRSSVIVGKPLFIVESSFCCDCREHCAHRHFHCTLAPTECKSKDAKNPRKNLGKNRDFFLDRGMKASQIRLYSYNPNK
jgi:hypothetical protein